MTEKKHTNHDEKIGFDTGCNAKLTDVLNDNEVIEVNGYCELSLKPYSSRILVVNDGSFKVNFDDKCEVKTVTANAPRKKEKKVEKLKKVQKGRYRHFKGTEYEVLGVSTHSETGEKLVIYMSVDGKETLWARPYDMFTDVVEHNGKKINRFTLLS